MICAAELPLAEAVVVAVDPAADWPAEPVAAACTAPLVPTVLEMGSEVVAEESPRVVGVEKVEEVEGFSVVDGIVPLVLLSAKGDWETGGLLEQVGEMASVKVDECLVR